MNKTYIISGVSSKDWNSRFIVRACGRAFSLRKFVDLFGIKGLERLIKYADRSLEDNCKVRISGVTIYVHFK